MDSLVLVENIGLLVVEVVEVMVLPLPLVVHHLPLVRHMLARVEVQVLAPMMVPVRLQILDRVAVVLVVVPLDLNKVSKVVLVLLLSLTQPKYSKD
jgi:hypothetical protein